MKQIGLWAAAAAAAATATGGVVLVAVQDRSAPIRPIRAVGAIQPRISPDGASIVFSYQGAIWRCERAGGTMRRLTSGPGFDENPAWSEDGKRIAYVDTFAGEIRVIDGPSGTGFGGAKLFFHGDRVVGHRRQAGLGALDVKTGLVHELEQVPPPACFCLSPDGSKVASIFTRDLPAEQSGNNGPEAVISVGGAEKSIRFPSRVFDMWWAPGDELVVSSDLGGAHNHLWAVPIKTPERARKLTSGQGDEDSPSVSADGRWLVYTDNRDGATAIVVRDLTTGRESPIEFDRLDFGKPAAKLRLKVLEQGTGRPITARVSLQEPGGKFAAPPGSLYRVQGGEVCFYVEGETELSIPTGRYHLHASRGIEYRVGDRSVDVPSETTIELERWTDPPARGWHGGESHIHANYGYGQWYNTPESMRVQADGEGLNVANLMVANSDSDGVFDREFFRGRPDPLSTPSTILYWNEEFRATLWGHMTLLNLSHLVEPIFTGFKDTTNPWDIPTNADVADHTHLQGGHVNFTHPANNAQDPFLSAYSAKSVPVDVALKKIDSLDINASFEATVPLWYRLLNCGFRLPASAGTDCFLNRLRGRVPGYDRVYVKLDGPLTYAKWIEGLRAGRTFVTNGPMLEFEAGGCGPGGTIELARPGPVRVRARATREAGAPAKIELVHNGNVIATGALDRDVDIAEGGWLSARAFGPGRQQAHASPIYVTVGAKSRVSNADAVYFLGWIRRLEEMLNARDRVPSAELKERVAAQLAAARAVYRGVAERGQ